MFMIYEENYDSCLSVFKDILQSNDLDLVQIECKYFDDMI